jgi:hypothetical protein
MEKCQSAQEFNERFFTKYDNIRWFEKKGILKINDDVNASIELAITNVWGEYPGYLVTIANKKEGKIDSHYFDFNSYLKTRVDDKQDLHSGFSIISHCGWDWYIAIPEMSEVLEMSACIMDYINLWA